MLIKTNFNILSLFLKYILIRNLETIIKCLDAHNEFKMRSINLLIKYNIK